MYPIQAVRGIGLCRLHTIWLGISCPKKQRTQHILQNVLRFLLPNPPSLPPRNGANDFSPAQFVNRSPLMWFGVWITALLSPAPSSFSPSPLPFFACLPVCLVLSLVLLLLPSWRLLTSDSGQAERRGMRVDSLCLAGCRENVNKEATEGEYGAGKSECNRFEKGIFYIYIYLADALCPNHKWKRF